MCKDINISVNEDLFKIIGYVSVVVEETLYSAGRLDIYKEFERAIIAKCMESYAEMYDYEESGQEKFESYFNHLPVLERNDV